MSTFNDNDGRTWILKVDYGTGRRVEAMTGVNLGTILQNNMQPLGVLVADLLQFVDVLYAMVKPEADKQGVSAETFGKAMVGDAFKHAHDAFIEALADFFPSHQKQLLTRLMTKLDSLTPELMRQADKEIDDLTAETLLQSVLSLRES